MHLKDLSKRIQQLVEQSEVVLSTKRTSLISSESN